MRGEYTRSSLATLWCMELPPRARRIPQKKTPTLGGGRNYLRVRGEYEVPTPQPEPDSELPPRARRIRAWFWYCACMVGTTSACAENTTTRISRAGISRNYLRVRGEYLGESVRVDHRKELPPRARRILSVRNTPPNPSGTTSACAENTCTLGRSRSLRGNYLRVRGEYGDRSAS